MSKVDIVILLLMLSNQAVISVNERRDKRCPELKSHVWLAVVGLISVKAKRHSPACVFEICNQTLTNYSFTVH